MHSPMHLGASVPRDHGVIELLEPRCLLASQLDLTFGEIGAARHALGRFVDVIALPGEHLLAFGESGGVFGTTGKPIIGRVAVLRPDGTLDTAFGGTGTRRLGKLGVTAAAVQADGKILLAGRSPGEDRVAIARLNPDGSYDITFGTRGVHVGADLGDSPSVTVGAITILPGGKIQLVVQSNKPDGSNVRIDLFRYHANGKPDSAFGVAGQKLLLDKAFIYRARAMDDGRTIVAGQSNELRAGPESAFVLRVLDDGTIDNGFYSRALNDRVGAHQVLDIEPQADDKIVLAVGTAVARLDTNGRLDTSFSDDGIIDLADEEFATTVTAVAVQNDGKIVATSYVAGSGVYEHDGFYRFNPDGRPDESFGPGGHITEPGDPRARWTTLLPTTDGNLIAAGQYAIPNWYIQQLDESPDVQLEDGTLYVRGGEGDDLVTLEIDPSDSDMARLIFNQTSTSYALAQVQRVVLFPGRGDDAVQIGLDVPVHVNAGEGSDTVTTAGGDDSIRTGAGNDAVTSGDGNDTLTGGTGGMVLTGAFNTGAGDDLIFDVSTQLIDAGTGNDTLRGSHADSVHAGDGNDRLERIGAAAVFGDAGNDTIIGSGNADGGAGDDILSNLLPPPPNDGTVSEDHPFATLRGGEGNDLLAASGRNFELRGDGGNDHIRASAFHIPDDGDSSFDDSLTGRSRAFGGDGNDTIHGGVGNNTLEGNAGNDRIYLPLGYASGGGGSDRIITRGSFGVTASGGDGNDHLTALEGGTLIGGNGDDILTGGRLLVGGIGEDTFFSRNGRIDTLDGGAGQDTATADEDDVLTSVEM